MFNISTKYNHNSDFKAVLSAKKSNLANLKKIIDLKSANILRDRASKNKRGITFVSQINNSKFSNLYFFNLDEKKMDFEIQDIGGQIVTEALSLKKNTIDLFIDTLPQSLRNNKKIMNNIFIGMLSRNYFFEDYKQEKEIMKINKINIITSNNRFIKQCLAYSKSINDGVTETRNLVTTPSNILNPANFVNQIKKLSKIGLKVEILDETKLKKLGMNALLGVGQGSANKSYVAIMKWNGGKKTSRPLGFIGKGVCFDTGGISLKPARFMEEMKYDMGGSAVVLGLMKALALRKTKANVSGIIGLVENMPSGTAQRPGDVVKSMSGQTIEVINTDAEGRLVLADILWYAQQKFQPKKIVDLATLTGAIIVSIGQEKAGMFSNNKDFADELTELGLKVGEEVWNMPVDDSYEKDIRSDIADMKNVGSGRGAGSTAGAIFLKRFIKNTIWMHLDIAGVTWAKSDRPMTPKGGSGYGVRLLDELVFKNFK